MSETPVVGGQEAPKNEQSNVDLIQGLRDEFQAQITTLKDENAQREKALQEEIESLKKERSDLQRALVREASVAPVQVPKEPEKTEEELYQERIKALAEITLKREKEII